MGEILPDGSIQGYSGYCPKCGEVIKTNMQGDEMGTHECCPMSIEREEVMAEAKTPVIPIKKTYVLMLSKNFFGKHPRKGQPTDFKRKIFTNEKKHTIRGNYGYWSGVAREVNAKRAVLSVRQWEGMPYRSKQVEVFQFSKLGCQHIEIDENGVIAIDGFYTEVPTELIAKNDGLSWEDFRNWFPLDKKFDGAILHFTELRY